MPSWLTRSLSSSLVLLACAAHAGPGLESLRRLEALDARVVVPGQGPAMHDKAYLRRTIELFAAVIDQVRAALAGGRVRLEDVQAAVDVDRIGREYDPGAPLGENFRPWVATLSRKAMQESLDGAGVR